jgi:carboxyl-terminal processing protease
LKFNMSSFDKFQRVLVSLLIAVSFFYGGYYFGKRGYVFEVKRNPPQISVINRSPDNQNVDFALFWQVWDMVSKEYLERPVDGQKMLYGAITGMVNSLGDPYTSYLPPEINDTVKDAINGTYTGIGAELDIKEGQLMVVAPLDGSPAKKSGVRPGDKILEIEGQPTIGISVTEAVSKIRGEAGTVSTLKLQRGVEEPFTVRIQRGVITVASVTWEDKGDGTAYIRVSRFGGDTMKEWQQSVKELNVRMSELDVIVLDLRGNPGGYLQAAVYLADEFVQKGTIVWEESAVGQQKPSNADRNGLLENIPQVYVLIDGGSASASEILAAALRDNIGAVLVGQKSFGKGTIQDAKDFKDGSGVHITIAKWLTPNKEWVHKVGIEPAIPVELDIDAYAQGVDTQLEKVLELARQI